MLGRGLESLIPNTNGDQNQARGSHPNANQQPQSPYFPPARSAAPQPAPAPVPVHDEVWPHHEPERPYRAEPVRPHHHEARPEQKESVFHIEIEKIKPNPYQPRREFNEEELRELAQSIREFGIIQPLTVTKIMTEAETGAAVEYQLIAGERRLRAAKLAGLERVPAIVRQMDSSRTKLEIALIENIQRSNLNPLESAKAYAKLQDEFDLTQREIAARVGKSRESVANTMRLLQLPSEIQGALAQSKLTESQGRTLLSIQDPNDQMRTFLEMMHKKGAPRDSRTRTESYTASANPEQKFLENRLEERLGAPVKISQQGRGGTIKIQYYSEEELRGIIDRLGGREE